MVCRKNGGGRPLDKTESGTEFEISVTFSEESYVDGPIPNVSLIVSPKKYSDSYYLLFGYEQLVLMLNLRGALDFLNRHAYNKNALE